MHHTRAASLSLVCLGMAEKSSTGEPTAPSREIVAPWSWGSGPRTFAPPTHVVLRAIRTGDYEALRSWDAPVVTWKPPTPRRQRRTARLLAALSVCCVLGGLLVLVLLVVTAW